MKEHKNIIDQLKNDDVYYKFSLDNLGREIVKKVLNLDTLNIDFSDFADQIDKNMLFMNSLKPESIEINNFSDIAKEFLHVKNAPADEFAYFCLEVKKLKKILNENISELEKQKKEINKSETIRIRLFEEYIARNKSYKEDLRQYLSNDIFLDVDRRSKIDKNGNHLGRTNYTINFLDYKINQAAGVNEDFLKIEHKLVHLPVPDFQKLFRLYNEDRVKFYTNLPSKFFIERIEKYLDKKEISNYFIYRRKETIEKLLTFFKTKDFFSFNTIVTLQIEGLFSDFSQMLGNEKNEKGSITSIVNNLGNEELLFGYEYFGYIFPIVRNDIAHGNYYIKHDDEQQYQYMHIDLLLDLCFIMEIFEQENIIFNKCIKYLKDFGKINPVDKLQLHIANYLNKNDKPNKGNRPQSGIDFEDILSHYGIDFEAIKEELCSDEFFAKFENFLLTHPDMIMEKDLQFEYKYNMKPMNLYDCIGELIKYKYISPQVGERFRDTLNSIHSCYKKYMKEFLPKKRLEKLENLSCEEKRKFDNITIDNFENLPTITFEEYFKNFYQNNCEK